MTQPSKWEDIFLYVNVLTRFFVIIAGAYWWYTDVYYWLVDTQLMQSIRADYFPPPGTRSHWVLTKLVTFLALGMWPVYLFTLVVLCIGVPLKRIFDKGFFDRFREIQMLALCLVGCPVIIIGGVHAMEYGFWVYLLLSVISFIYFYWWERW